MPAGLIAIFVFAIVAVIVFVAGLLLDQRSARARLIRERLATVQKAPERAPEEELALLRDEQLSQIPALDNFLRRSERVSAVQKVLAQAGMTMRAGNFLGLCALSGIVAAFAVFTLSKNNPAFAWFGMKVGMLYAVPSGSVPARPAPGA